MTPDLPSHEERRRVLREQWASEVADVLKSFPLVTFGLVAGGYESGLLLSESVTCYRNGLFLAALICAHATCERELAGRIAHRPAEAPNGWERWGLGRLIQHAREQGWHTPPTLALLEAVNEKRRSAYHFRGFTAENGLFLRTYATRPWEGKYELSRDSHDQLRTDALEAIRAALAVRAE